SCTHHVDSGKEPMLLYHGPRLFKIKFNHSIIVFNDYRIGGYTIGDINLCIRFMYQVTYS
ncbi:hypothetical protein, partial [Bacteroides cellulosilyticus]|uniref:hypothetical protein n=1 Tax=Bacteroides cellulosilyticus TaxID=246787 RepID=UPI0032EB9DE1